ncbi:DUF5819 family protein [Streptacidiphilus sp. EB129]|uniref:DUF5819 family protein n=1 Tax=Streptacidiphilus sp. EB129 TaxID=3156262 RepID=UPI00351576E4
MAEHPGETAAEPEAIPGPTLPAQRSAPSEARPPAEAEAPAGADTPAASAAPAEAGTPTGAGARRWSTASLLTLAAAAVMLVGATAWHLGTVFLSIAPSNTLSQSYQSTISAHVNPEFEQNWQLFAPNPLQDNIAIEVRLQTLAADGSRPQSGWINLTARDIAQIRDNPAPSHINQNLLRRAWDYYTSWHNQSDESSLGSGGPLSKEYLKRIALQRLGRDWNGNPIIEVQFRSASTPVGGPAWTGAPQQPQTSYRTPQWWPVADDDYVGLH